MPEAGILSVDVGGTFTDVLHIDHSGTIRSHKLRSVAPHKFAASINNALTATSTCNELLYSTTVALNTLLSGELPRIGLLVTAGFRDILETARLPAHADEGDKHGLPPRLVGLEWVREIDARMAPDGSERRPVDSARVAQIAEAYAATGIEVVAVCLLHSYLNPQHEAQVAATFNETAPDIKVICSSVVLPELREYERTLATVLNASLVPVLTRHLQNLSGLSAVPKKVWCMRSNGGLVGAETVVEEPLATALSGPCATVVGARRLAVRSGYPDLITLDVGGTSTDVSVIRNGSFSLTTNGQLAGFPLKMPMVDVHSIGAGGGSIAHAAADQRWHVGPDSAAAEPGPACYANGGNAPTLTDAQLLLGRLPGALLGGSLPLNRDSAERVLERFGATRGFSAVRTAQGVLDIATHNMCSAIRTVTIARGYDPADFALFVMGGAGPAHGAEVAELLGMDTVVVTPQPGLAAPLGLMAAEVTRDFVYPLGILADALDIASIESAVAELNERIGTWLHREGIIPTGASTTIKLDLRYAGMTHETSIECDASARGLRAVIESGIDRFHQHFEQMTGRSWRDRETVEIVNLRVVASVAREHATLPHASAANSADVVEESTRQVGFVGATKLFETPIYDRCVLTPTKTIAGPAVIEQYETTVVVPPYWIVAGDPHGNLVLRRAASV